MGFPPPFSILSKVLFGPIAVSRDFLTFTLSFFLLFFNSYDFFLLIYANSKVIILAAAMLSLRWTSPGDRERPDGRI
jgi:hypothetical protein